MNRLFVWLTNLGLVMLFAMLAALSTVLVWILLSLFTAKPFAIDAMGYWPMMVGLAGPVLV
jgi:hypothetical protein